MARSRRRLLLLLLCCMRSQRGTRRASQSGWSIVTTEPFFLARRPKNQSESPTKLPSDGLDSDKYKCGTSKSQTPIFLQVLIVFVFLSLTSYSVCTVVERSKVESTSKRYKLARFTYLRFQSREIQNWFLHFILVETGSRSA